VAKRNHFDELDEMLGTQDEIIDASEGAQKPKKPKKVSKKDAGKPPYQRQKEAKKRKETRRTIAICVSIFAVVVVAVVALGLAMGERAGVGNFSRRAKPDPDRTSFTNNAAMPELSPEGVKGMLKEAYFTVDGDLAVTFRLSNGTNVDHTVATMDVLIFNDQGVDVAKQTFTTFRPKIVVPAGGFEDAYMIVDKENVLSPEDPLYSLGSTLQISSESQRKDDNDVPSNPDDPKAIAPNRTYFEALGNQPPLSAEKVEGRVIGAKYTNDGSLAVTLSLSNGMEVDQQVTEIQLVIDNGDGTRLAAQTFKEFDSSSVVLSQAYKQLEVIIDTANVSVKDDSLHTLTCSVGVTTAPVA